MSDESEQGEESGGSGRPAAADRAEVSRLWGVAALLVASVFLSRVSGYLRDLVLANRVGAGPETDAYFIAFLLPDLLNYLLAGGALAIAFIPVYTRTRERRGEAAAGRLFATVLGGLGALALVGTCGLWILAEDIAAAQLTGFDAPTRALCVHLMRIILPAQVAFITGGILRAVLMAHGRFAAQAAAPLLYNGAVIIGGIVGGDVEGFAWGVLVGAVLGNWLGPLLELRKVRAVRLRLALFDADFRHYLWVAAPLMLGISLATVDEWYEKFLGVALAEGSVSLLGYARKLMMVPVAVIGQALGAAALPVLSQLYSRGREPELNELLLKSLRVALALGVLAGAGVFVLSDPIVVFFFRHGRFDAAAAERVAQLLAVMALATPAWVVQQIAVRAFFAREDSWRPMLLGTGVAFAVIPLYLLLRGSHGVQGLAAAGVIAMGLNSLATLVWARVRHGAPRAREMIDALARSLGIAFAAAGAASAVQQLGVGRSGAALDLMLGGAAFTAVALPGCLLFGDPATRELLVSLGRRLACLGRRLSSVGRRLCEPFRRRA